MRHKENYIKKVRGKEGKMEDGKLVKGGERKKVEEHKKEGERGM